ESIEEQGKMTPELHQQILLADNLVALEDIYQPYKPKRHTRASIAREKGLEGLATLIIKQSRVPESMDKIVKPYLNDKVANVEEALAGARDIVAEMISDHTEVRKTLREKALVWSLLQSSKLAKADDPKLVFESYYEFEYQVDRIKPHQVLAINRGEAEEVLSVSVNITERDWRNAIGAYFRPDSRSPFAAQMELAIEDSASRLLLPSIERDVRKTLTEKAEAHAIKVFASNLSSLLTTPMLAGYVVMGLDPGFRTGCKVAVVDPTGKLLDIATIYPHEPQKKSKEALETLEKLVNKHKVNLISIGNGTASRETEQLVAQLTRSIDGLNYVITSEAGASVYSASPLARSEFPDLDVSIRGAVSIARRVQDPLAELVKIDPKAIGVGLYQHDVDQKELSNTLGGVVESVVNRVGVDINTASPALLSYVSGIGQKLAERIVEFRNENGAFANRTQIKQVSGLGPKAFEQAAGFLRIRNGDNPLDASAIHPESYHIAAEIIKFAKIQPDDSIQIKTHAIDELRKTKNIDSLAEQLKTGVLTLTDILEQLVRPGRDPRQDLPAPILRSDVMSMEDLVVGMKLKGTVRNVVDFGAFVDIGVKQDGLLHRSQFIPGQIPQVSDVISVEIIKIEIERGRISLKMAG
ncbi:MAG: RNA-binding transcriptional accessory protein, partial [Anaerolineae bacterium]|nr:RNA-binding transcriptional accessory protein [Anaerolineae bacterium]